MVWNHGILTDFPYIGNNLIPTDELIFFRGVGIPPTSNGTIIIKIIIMVLILLLIWALLTINSFIGIINIIMGK